MYTWAGRGLRPLDPRTEIPRAERIQAPAVDAAVAGSGAGRIMSARRSRGPAAHGQPRPSNRFASAFGDRPRPTVRESSCGPAARLALVQDEQAQRMRRSVVAENRSRDRIGHHRPHTDKPPSSSTPATADGHGGRSRGAADHRENVRNHSDAIAKVETEGDTARRIEKQRPREEV